AQHLDRRFTQHREVQRRAFSGSIREHDLMSQGRLTGTWLTGDEIERVFGQSSIQNQVETRNAGLEFVNGDFSIVIHALVPSLVLWRRRNPEMRPAPVSWLALLR